MTVYVDSMKAGYGRMKMCHMWADTREELFEMAKRIGVQLKWFQRPDGDCEIGMKASWEHFDIAQTKRYAAVQHGAVETCMFTMAEHANRQTFIKRIKRGEFERAIYPLRMMCLAANCRRTRL